MSQPHVRYLDSYQKFANDVFVGSEDVFKHVNPQDKDDVRVQFARMIAEADQPSNLRVFPLHMIDKYGVAKFAVEGNAYDTQVKAQRTGRVYWVGFHTEVVPSMALAA
jgi:hypothetical protein